jgi:solute carrier family 10 (sodium/bile acid cotransporter), member 7
MVLVIICDRIMHKLFSLLSRAGLNFFVLLMIAVVGLGWLFPEPGSRNGSLHLVQVGNVGVTFIFFFYGLKLEPAKLLAGLGHWKMHVLIQTTTFLIFPLLILMLRTIFYTSQFDLLWLGVFYLAALPSTVSSSVVMVSIAGGNISAAIFNASISSLLGIFVTPLWMNIFVSSSAFSTPDLSGVILNLCLQVLLPVVAGLALHKRLGFLAVRFKNQLRYFDQAIILLIVYRAFCDSFLNRMFDGYSLTELALLGSLMLMLFIVMFAFMQIISVGVGLSREDRITVVFCGSKKSLVQGALMGQVLFPEAAAFGIVLLPLMLYHALQLVTGSILAERMAKVSNS